MTTRTDTKKYELLLLERSPKVAVLVHDFPHIREAEQTAAVEVAAATSTGKGSKGKGEGEGVVERTTSDGRRHPLLTHNTRTRNEQATPTPSRSTGWRACSKGPRRSGIGPCICRTTRWVVDGGALCQIP